MNKYCVGAVSFFIVTNVLNELRTSFSSKFSKTCVVTTTESLGEPYTTDPLSANTPFDFSTSFGKVIFISEPASFKVTLTKELPRLGNLNFSLEFDITYAFVLFLIASSILLLFRYFSLRTAS